MTFGGSLKQITLTCPWSVQRWYPSSARLSDGSQIVIGGATSGDFNDDDSRDNPTVSYILNAAQDSANGGRPCSDRIFPA